MEGTLFIYFSKVRTQRKENFTPARLPAQNVLILRF